MSLYCFIYRIYFIFSRCTPVRPHGGAMQSPPRAAFVEHVRVRVCACACVCERERIPDTHLTQRHNLTFTHAMQAHKQHAHNQHAHNTRTHSSDLYHITHTEVLTHTEQTHAQTLHMLHYPQHAHTHTHTHVHTRTSGAGGVPSQTGRGKHAQLEKAMVCRRQ